MNQSIPRTLGLILLCWSSLAAAHHSTLRFYEPEKMIDIEGVVTKTVWSNPHVHFEIAVTDADGATVDWEIELSAYSMLRTRGFDQEFIAVGDHIRIAGNPSRNGSPSMAGLNVLRADGVEVLADRNSTPYFQDANAGHFLEPVFDTSAEQHARMSAKGIFRVWSTVLNDPSFPMYKGNYPLTETAAQVRANWAPIAEEQLSCWEKGMPLLMVTPHPIEFSQQGEDILMRFEEDDAERLIHMNTAGQTPATSTLLGYSNGHWEGHTLVVETSQINAPAFDDRGAPIGKDIRLVERFSLSDDEQRLDYRITFYDPETFTEPFDLTRYWVWRPELTVHKWDCVD